MSRVLPVLFNTDMVRAILDRRKTVTRRAIKPQPTYNIHDGFSWKGYAYGNSLPPSVEGAAYNFQCAVPYHPGDILYVRETWQYLYELDGNEQIIEGTGKYYYATTDTLPFGTYVDSMGVTHEGIPWKPSIHMPKEAARIWLKVTDVRVERLQEITNEQILKEGANKDAISHYIKQMPSETGEWIRAAYLVEWSQLWDSTIKRTDLNRYGWEANPWVWAVEFERCEKPESI